MSPSLPHLKHHPYLKRSARRARVEIIPLIDVMFLLVAFFMVITISMVMQKGIFVDLSPAETGDDSGQEEQALVLSIDAKERFYLNKEEFDSHELFLRLEMEARSNPDRFILINADRASRHERVIEVLDLVRRAGLHNVVFSVEPRS